MNTLLSFDALHHLLETGGPVVLIILSVGVLIWLLILERFWYLFSEHPQRLARYLAHWRGALHLNTWQRDKIRIAMISDLSLGVRQHLSTIKALIAVCPLLGLLGTVIGMIDVFDVLAVMGTGNARAMAKGISQATLPTMAGMVVALSGLYFSAALERRAKVESFRLVDHFCKPADLITATATATR
jgi:biopolymer transport protein ExbB